MATLTMAAAQFAPVDDPDANLDTVRAAARDAAARGAQLLVTPEYTSYFTADIDDRFVAAAQPLDGPFVTGLRQVAREHGLALVVGIAETTGRTDRFRNTLVAIDRTGELRCTYRKVHLYDAFGSRESDRIEPGDPEQLPVFDLDGVRIGLETCYDLRFPEVTRRLVEPDSGAADLVVLPAEWVRGPGKEHHWRTLLTARAIENTTWVLGVGQAPPVGIGGSVLLDPSGVATAALGGEPGLLVGVVDTDVTDRVRRVNPSLSLRRYDVTVRSGRTTRPT
ncbi:carbon-nitrogen hydrolase family protein [Microbacterium sp. M1A1_1b]